MFTVSSFYSNSYKADLALCSRLNGYRNVGAKRTCQGESDKRSCG